MNALKQAQLEADPDSVFLTDAALIDLISSPPRILHNKAPEEYVDHVFDLLARERNAYNDARQLAVSVAVAKIESPEGLFYLAGKQSDGSYRWFGQRYGVEASQYKAFHMGRPYTPQKPL